MYEIFEMKNQHKKIMALVEKKGGRYNKKDQEERRKEVHRLHFEFGYSARKIAEMMKINRNTINADIKYWYSEIRNEIGTNAGLMILKQFQRLETNRNEINEELSQKEKNNSVTLRKLLFAVDNKIIELCMKINFIKIDKSLETLEEIFEISDDEMKKIIKNILPENKFTYLSDEEVIFEIMKTTKENLENSRKIFQAMKLQGLNLCRCGQDDFENFDKVNLNRFAILKNYIKEN